MFLDGLDEVVTTAGLEATYWTNPRADEDLIAPNGLDHQPSWDAKDDMEDAFHVGLFVVRLGKRGRLIVIVCFTFGEFVSVSGLRDELAARVSG